MLCCSSYNSCSCLSVSEKNLEIFFLGYYFKTTLSLKEIHAKSATKHTCSILYPVLPNEAVKVA
jgi:hypothetical protein